MGLDQQGKVHREQGGDSLVVLAVDGGQIKGQATASGAPAQAAALTNLTDSSGGTANDTVAAVSGSGADADINNNFADLTAKVNALITACRNAGILAQ